MRWQQRFSYSMHSMRRLEMRAAMVAMCAFVSACAGEPHGRPVRVIVPRGASFGQAADSLAKNGIIGSQKLFTLYGRIVGGDRNIKPGTYLLKHGTPWSDIINALNGGHGLVNTVTIPEGWTIAQSTRGFSNRGGSRHRAARAPGHPESNSRRLSVPGHVRVSDRHHRPPGGARDGVRLRTKVETIVGLGGAGDENQSQRPGDDGVDRREGSQIARGASRHRGGVLQSIAKRDAATGGSDGPVRTRTSRRSGVVQGSRDQITVQHLHEQRPPARADRIARRRKPRSSGQSRERAVSLLRRNSGRASRIQDDARAAHQRSAPGARRGAKEAGATDARDGNRADAKGSSITQLDKVHAQGFKQVNVDNEADEQADDNDEIHD
jgi:YceG-like family